jgi:site-specific recombinase XerD
MLNKKGVSELAGLSKLSKAYMSQVKHGQRPPSQHLVEALLSTQPKSPTPDYIDMFFKSRSQGLSHRTIQFYSSILVAAYDVARPGTSPSRINAYLKSLNGNMGNKHAHFRALRAFYNWLYSPRSGVGLKLQDNPILYVDPPKTPKLILPALSKGQVELLINKAINTRDKAIIALFCESGLRLSELTHIKPKDIDWLARTIRVMGKGRKEGYAPFGDLTEHYLKQWLAQFQPNSNIWGLNQWGIISMLRRLKDITGLTCNPHTFRRTFACLLRKAGVDTMTIKDLGRWESLEMVQRYTRSVTFQDCMKHYKAPLSQAL